MKKVFFTAVTIIWSLLYCSAQTPQWQWAKGIGGNHQESLLNAGNTLQLDNLGNSYEVITSQSTSMVMGGATYINPAGTGNNVAYFVKYNPSGNVVWVKKFGNFPASAGGGPLIPQSFCTNSKGESFLQFYFVDSIKLGGVNLIDTIVGHTYGNYCIAKYDANGNVLYIKAHKGKNSGLLSIRQFMKDKMFAVGLVNQSGDTINGSLIPQGIFMALMDTLGYLTNIKSIGYDSVSGNFLMDNRSFAVSNQSVYMETYFFHPLIYQTTIPINNIRQYADTIYQGTGKTLFIKFDSLLNFQWYKVGNSYIGNYMAADSHDNLYLGSYCPSTPQVDTIKIDSLNYPMPFIPPYGANSYLGTFKFNGNGNFQWQNNIIVSGTNGVSSTCFDKQDNVYLYGAYQSYLIAGTDTLNEASNLFVNKIANTGNSIWVKTTQNGARCSATGIAEDGQGNIFVNGLYSDPNYPVAFGTDTLLCHTPVAGYPLAADVFNAKLSVANLLPLTLLSFNAVNKNLYALITWQTANEINTSKFMVQRSANGIAFSDIGIVAAKGNNRNAYEFEDTGIGNNTMLYYRLKMMDNDGRFTYSKIVLIKREREELFSIFPNPANGFATLYFNDPVKTVAITIYTATGDKIITQAFKNPGSQVQVNTSHLSTGVYIVEVKTGTGIYQRQLLVYQ
jgi:hypothetical protein